MPHETVTLRTCDLIGAALDWAVAKAVGVELSLIGSHPHAMDGEIIIGHYKPSTDWSQGGPLIGLYHVLFDETEDGQLLASCTIVPCPSHQFDRDGEGVGQDHLIAACRAIVSAHLGDSVDVPAELVGGGV